MPSINYNILLINKQICRETRDVTGISCLPTQLVPCWGCSMFYGLFFDDEDLPCKLYDNIHRINEIRLHVDTIGTTTPIHPDEQRRNKNRERYEMEDTMGQALALMGRTWKYEWTNSREGRFGRFWDIRPAVKQD